ncbi:unnamed protein product [Gongylonema pulchrum]|uniref:Exosome complex component CSL4 n=1 Tax=Gongylonema pulchrum TaxID=637853 RepID=A0A183DSD8_9BILA|nr:unnamed protein product [Gongylonema pulchrum]
MSVNSSRFSTPEASSKFVVPGDRLFPISEDLKAGTGTYELYGYIHASLAGKLHMYTSNDHGKEIKVVEVRRESEKDKSHVMPYIGCIVTAKVQNIGQRFAKCSIHCVENSTLSNEFSGILRKEDIMPVEKEKIKLHQCVHPGDVILARVIGFGENLSSYLLSTSEDELGVVSGIGDLGEKLTPCSQNEVKSVVTGMREPRKVAQIADLNR